VSERADKWTDRPANRTQQDVAEQDAAKQDVVKQDVAQQHVLLRPAEPADVRAIAEFQTRCWRQAYRGLVAQDYLDQMDGDRREPVWRQRLVTGSRRIALAEIDGDLVGVVSWGAARTSDDAPPLELKSLYVDAARHGSGVAAALMHVAIADADAQLWCYEDNPRARAFYAKQGFQPDGERIIDPDTGLWELRLVRRT
jgi:GNAT superfamily N-acetyltransferase